MKPLGIDRHVRETGGEKRVVGSETAGSAAVGLVFWHELALFEQNALRKKKNLKKTGLFKSHTVLFYVQATPHALVDTPTPPPWSPRWARIVFQCGHGKHSAVLKCVFECLPKILKKK